MGTRDDERDERADAGTMSRGRSASAGRAGSADGPARSTAADGAAVSASAAPPAAACAARCQWCGVVAPVVWVHGHGQCAACGTNREPCCQPD